MIAFVIVTVSISVAYFLHMSFTELLHCTPVHPQATEDSKLCKQCKQWLPLSRFGKEMGTPGLKKTKCRACLAANNKGAAAARRILGPAPPSGHRCLCGKVYPGGIRGRAWVPDHDHQTHTARGWLCRECNTGFGKIEDDPNILIAQMCYLLSHGKKCQQESWQMLLGSLDDNERNFFGQALTLK